MLVGKSAVRKRIGVNLCMLSSLNYARVTIFERVDSNKAEKRSHDGTADGAIKWDF